MIIIVCLDEKDGMMFNHRRQSRDEVVCQQILNMTQHSKLWLNEYSKQLFENASERVCVDSCFLERAQGGEYCFVEDQSISEYINKIEQLVIFRWNRLYPADFKFPMQLVPADWTMRVLDEFPGKSHDKITVEVYQP